MWSLASTGVRPMRAGMRPASPSRPWWSGPTVSSPSATSSPWARWTRCANWACACRDIAVAGFDSIPDAARAAYGITSFEQPLSAMVRRGLDLLTARASPMRACPTRRSRCAAHWFRAPPRGPCRRTEQPANPVPHCARGSRNQECHKPNPPAHSLQAARHRRFQLLAAPTVSMHLADMGADVIKLERPGGDEFRNWACGATTSRCITRSSTATSSPSPPISARRSAWKP